MKTIILTEDDVIELRILRSQLEAQQQHARYKSQQKADRNIGMGSVAVPFTTDEERNARKGVAILTKILS